MIENCATGEIIGRGYAVREPTSVCAQRGGSIKVRRSRGGLTARGNTTRSAQPGGEQQGGFLAA